MYPNFQYAQVISDENSTTVTYFGFAQANFTLTSAALWCILKITQTSGTSPVGVTTYAWAGEPGVFNAVWDNRTGLTYTS